MPSHRSSPTRRHVSVAVAGTLVVAVAVATATLVALGLLLPIGPADQPARHGAALADGYSVWERNEDGEPVRWDPCRPIVIVHDLAAGPADLTDDLKVAVDRLRDATGLDLVVAGRVDEHPRGDRPPYLPERYGDRWAPVLVAWAEPREAGLPLRDVDRGIGVPIAVGRPGDRAYVSGQVVLNADRSDLRPGFDDRATSWGATLLHELAHVLGLGHVDDPAQLMHVRPGDGPVRFGAGDLAGLRAVGAELGCRPAPPPRPVEVADPPDVGHP